MEQVNDMKIEGTPFVIQSKKNLDEVKLNDEQKSKRDAVASQILSNKKFRDRMPSRPGKNSTPEQVAHAIATLIATGRSPKRR